MTDPTNVRFAVDLLTCKDDWKTWKFQMKLAFKYQIRGLDMIEGTYPEPPEPLTPPAGSTAAVMETYNANYERWERNIRNYNKVASFCSNLIVNSVDRKTKDRLVDLDSPKAMWDLLVKLFEPGTEDRVSKLCADYHALRVEKDETIGEFVNRCVQVHAEYSREAAKGEHNNNLLIIEKMLRELPASFSNFRAHWRMQKPEMKTLDNFEKAISAEAADQTVGLQNTALAAFKPNAGSSKPSTSGSSTNKHFTCFYCQGSHKTNDCHKWAAAGRPKFALPAGHSWSPSGFVVSDRWSSGPGKKAHRGKKRVNLVTGSTEATPPEISTSTFMVIGSCLSATRSTGWHADSGATNHITNQAEFFEDYETFKTPHGVRTAEDGKELPALGKGRIRLEANVGGKTSDVVFADVWYIPSISHNLFSVLQALDSNRDVKFSAQAEHCELQRSNGQVLLTGARAHQGGLFQLHVKSKRPQATIAAAVAAKVDGK